MKRAQIEMMGFVIVVILVTIGMFFMVSLRQPPAKKTTFTVYTDEKLASSFLITLLETHVSTSNGNKIKLHDYAVDCVRTTQKYPHPCTKTKDVTTTILEDTLKKWGYSYNFTYTYTDASNNKNELIIINEGSCTGERSAPGWQPISLFRVAPGNAVMRLDICT